jgi:hypothetical protein
MQALAGDSTARIDSSGYRWYCPQKLARILKATPGVFLKEHFKQNNYRLWDTFRVLQAAKVCAGAGTSPHLECPGMAFCS